MFFILFLIFFIFIACSSALAPIKPLIRACTDEKILETGRQSWNSSVNVFDAKGKPFTVSVKKVNTLLLFFGYGRSGHSLIAALLDAHPQIAIANGFVDLMQHHDGVLNGTNLLEQILLRSIDRAKHDNRVAGYSYAVPGEYNGKFQNLQVVGVKKGGDPTSLETLFLKKKQQLAAIDDVKMVARCLGCELRILHVLRNPFDMLTAQVLRKKTAFYKPNGENFDAKEVLKETSSLSSSSSANRQNPNFAWQRVNGEQLPWQILPFYNAIINFERRHTALHKLSNVFGSRIWKKLKLESMITEPRESILELCQWLGVECTNSYIEDCTKKMFSEPHLARYHVKWNITARDELNEYMSRGRFEELNDYIWRDEDKKKK